MKKGYRNKITDVKGVRVGHKTIAAGNVQTGVTVILRQRVIFFVRS